MKTLITGARGFIGMALSKTLQERGEDVTGTGRENDVRDCEAIERLLRELRPTRIFHLAAQNNVMESFRSPQETVQSNVNGTLNLLEAARKLEIDGLNFISVGSSAEYGAAADTHDLLTEDLAPMPRNPYGASKAAQGLMSMVFEKAYGVHVTHVRPFAIVGPGKEKDVVSDFCRGVVDVERGLRDVITVGHLESKRDFVDVRDAAEALCLIAEKGRSGETYNICNENCISLQETIEELRRLARKPFSVVRDPARKRPTDDLKIVGSNWKIRALGYKPKYSFSETLASTLDYWRAR